MIPDDGGGLVAAVKTVEYEYIQGTTEWRREMLSEQSLLLNQKLVHGCAGKTPFVIGQAATYRCVLRHVSPHFSFLWKLAIEICDGRSSVFHVVLIPI